MHFVIIWSGTDLFSHSPKTRLFTSQRQEKTDFEAGTSRPHRYHEMQIKPNTTTRAIYDSRNSFTEPMEQNMQLVKGPAGSRQEKSPSPIGSCSGLRSAARASSSSSSSRLCKSKQTAEHEPGRFTNQKARGPSDSYRTCIFKCSLLAALR